MYYQENTIGASNWPRDLEAARRGEGDFGVPMPNPLTTLSDAYINLNRAQVLMNQVQNWIDTTYQDTWDLIPMQTIVTILKQTIYAYQVFIAELKKEQIPDKPVPVPDPVNPDIPETPVETPKTNNMPLYLIGGGLVGLYLYQRSRKKRVSGKTDGIVPIAIGIGALLLLTKKKTTTPVVEVIDSPSAAANYTAEENLYVR